MKICGHGTVLALHRCVQNVFLTNVSELLRRKKLTPNEYDVFFSFLENTVMKNAY